MGGESSVPPGIHDFAAADFSAELVMLHSPQSSWNSEKSLQAQCVQLLPVHNTACTNQVVENYYFYDSLVQHGALYLRTAGSVNFAAESPILTA